MRAIRVRANLHVDDLESAKEFYAGFLGSSDELMNHRCLVRAPDGTIVNVVGHAD